MERDQGRDTGDLPADDKMKERKGEEARKELDEIPAPGTDPLHEGP